MVPKKVDRKRIAIELKGGKCQNPNCPLPNHGIGLDPCCFDFHHRNPMEKDFNLKSLHSFTWDVVLIELEKCDLLCAICHRLEHKTNSLAKQLRKHNRGEKTYYTRRKRGLTHEEALTNPVQPGRNWKPKDLLTINGTTKPVKQWCKEYSLNYHTFKSRTYLRGMDPKKALELPTTLASTLTIDGETKTISEWCAANKVKTPTYYKRVRNGWAPEEAITAAPKIGKPQLDDNEILRLHGDGLSNRQIARELGTSHLTIGRRLSKISLCATNKQRATPIQSEDNT